jgi:23S rRNA pseudouridine1911/1915/1917 synthase
VNETPNSISLSPLTSDTGKRLDAYLAENIDGWTRSRLQRLIADEDVLVNDKTVKASYKVRGGDAIEVELAEVPVARFEPEDIPLDIVFEDEYLAVINKPAGMVVHPGAGVQSRTLANAIAYHFSPLRRRDAEGNDTRCTELQKPAREQGRYPERGTDQPSHRVGIVHRLDKDTSGLIVVAKNEEAAEALSAQFHDRKVYKSYVALVHGSPERNSGTIDAAIARNKHNRLRMKVAAHGRTAISLWKVRQRFEKFTLLDVEIKTGRTHQIRVHMAYINHPIVGDEIYNEGRDNTVADINVRNAVRNLGRFFLHAERLSFTHPKTGERMALVQEMPADLQQFLRLL